MRSFGLALLVVAGLSAGGCHSPYHADRGALFGGLTGAGVGAIVGNAVGDTGAGAAIGAGVGALTGAAVGSEMDEMEARNRAQIAAAMGSQAPSGAVTFDDVIAMTQSGISDRLIVTHIQYHSAASAVTAQDMIYLKQQGVSDDVLAALQTPPRRPQPVVHAAPTPVIVEEYYYAPRPHYWRHDWRHHPWHHPRYHRRHRGHSSVGFSFSTR